MQDCIFCKIVGGEIPARLVRQNERTVAFLDAFPLTAGHVLVVPKIHYAKLQEMSSEDSVAFIALVQELIPRIESVTRTNASLLAIHNGKEAGQEIPHVHLHIIPRKVGDGAGPVHSMFEKPQLTPEELDEILSKMV